MPGCITARRTGDRLKGEAPDCLGFPYLALTVGMTFEVSDTDLSGMRIPQHRPAPRVDVVLVRVMVAVTVNVVEVLSARAMTRRRARAEAAPRRACDSV
jgi:uncharacterized membrane protein